MDIKGSFIIGDTNSMLIENSNNVVKFGKEGRRWFLTRVNMDKRH